MVDTNTKYTQGFPCIAISLELQLQTMPMWKKVWEQLVKRVLVLQSWWFWWFYFDFHEFWWNFLFTTGARNVTPSEYISDPIWFEPPDFCLLCKLCTSTNWTMENFHEDKVKQCMNWWCCLVLWDFFVVRYSFSSYISPTFRNVVKYHSFCTSYNC